MDTQIDWRTELDGSFGHGPDGDVAQYLAQRTPGRTPPARRGVRRERSRSPSWSAVRRGRSRPAPPPAVPRHRSPADGPSPDPPDLHRGRPGGATAQPGGAAPGRAARIDFLGNPAAIADGGLVLAPGAGPVLERTRNPMGYTEAQGISFGLRVMLDGRERYSLLTSVGEGTDGSTTTVAATGDFAGWLDQAVRTQRELDVVNGVTPSSGDTSDAPWLVLGEDGTVRGARDGIVVVEVQEPVDLGATSFADGSTRTGAARLVVDGRSEYAAYRVLGGTLDVVPGGGRFASLSAFLVWARGQYASGEGMR